MGLVERDIGFVELYIHWQISYSWSSSKRFGMAVRHYIFQNLLLQMRTDSSFDPERALRLITYHMLYLLNYYIFNYELKNKK